ncbi:PilZ domain-containing protein [Desulfocurvibacter africanus]|uniref:PilZ domain-containing protein n=1 Tax=Desulfocurvibacter africanus TaxID=873 RepID=UPI0004898B70|nr:PilZ domain-containing protein [Desulfocurvibacter africanus]
MSSQRSFARVSTLINGRLRRIVPGRDRALFHDSSPTLSFSPQKLAEARLPEPLLEFLLSLDTKLDTLLSLASRQTMEQDFPTEIQVVEISAAGLSFVSLEQFSPGQRVEVVLTLSQAPLRMASALGEVVRVKVEGGERRQVLEFTSVRDRDRESIVQFVFQEERSQIRQAKWS